MADDQLERFRGEGGKFISPLPEYPGYFRLPDPFLGRHYRAWLKATREKVGDEVSDLNVFVEWRGAAVLVEEWAVDNVPRGDVDPSGDNIPEKVKAWIRLCVAVYLAEQFNPKELRGGSKPIS